MVVVMCCSVGKSLAPNGCGFTRPNDTALEDLHCRVGLSALLKRGPQGIELCKRTECSVDGDDVLV